MRAAILLVAILLNNGCIDGALSSSCLVARVRGPTEIKLGAGAGE
jgi:hypothetical protein